MPTGTLTTASLAEEVASGATAAGAKLPSKTEASNPERKGGLPGVLRDFKPPDLSLAGDWGSFPSPVEVAVLALLWLCAGAILAYVLTFGRR